MAFPDRLALKAFDYGHGFGVHGFASVKVAECFYESSSVTEIAKPFKISLPAITKHLKVLERCGLIARSRDAQWRPCRLKAQPMKEAVDWLEDYRGFWEASFDRLEDYLQELQKKEKTKGKDHDHKDS